jgi:hypothetical protein
MPTSRQPWREPSAVLGVTLLLLGLLLTTWRLHIDLAARHALSAARHAPSAGRGPVIFAVSKPGRAPGAALASSLPVGGAPTLAATLVDAILADYHSPLQGEGARMVALSRHYQIDDAVALAFFVMESRAGTQGEAVLTHSPGNLRPMQNVAERDGYSTYTSWAAGTDEWFRVMRTLYLDTLKLSTVEAVMPVYAPVWDSNDPDNMVAGIRQLVACWRGDVASCPDDPPGVPALVARAWGLRPVTATATPAAVQLPSS